MTFDRAAAVAEADRCERNLQLLYRVLGVPYVSMKLLDNALVVRCDVEGDVPALCKKVLDEYAPPAGETLN
jgi:hypothetical protein